MGDYPFSNNVVPLKKYDQRQEVWYQQIQLSETDCTAKIPEEILYKIFESLASKDIVRSVLPVCKRWWIIGITPFFWKNITVFKELNLCCDTLVSTLEQYPKILSIKGKRAFTTITTDLSEYKTDLHVEISKKFLNCIKNCNEIEHLTLPPLSSFEKVLDPQFNLESLTSLSTIPYNVHVNELERFLPRCPSLTKFKIKSVSMEVKPILNDEFICSLYNKHFLKTIDLRGVFITLQSYFEILIHCQFLEMFKIFLYAAEHCHITHTSIDILAQRGAKLKYLSINCGNLSACNKIAYNHNGFQNLETLIIKSCQTFTNSIISEICLCYPNLTTLYIDLYFGQVTDAGISTIFSNCTKLRQLGIMRAPVFVSENCFDNLPIKLPFLVKLVLDSCKNITKSLGPKLMAEKKDLKVKIIDFLDPESDVVFIMTFFNYARTTLFEDLGIE